MPGIQPVVERSDTTGHLAAPTNNVAPRRRSAGLWPASRGRPAHGRVLAKSHARTTRPRHAGGTPALRGARSCDIDGSDAREGVKKAIRVETNNGSISDLAFLAPLPGCELILSMRSLPGGVASLHHRL